MRVERRRCPPIAAGVQTLLRDCAVSESDGGLVFVRFVRAAAAHVAGRGSGGRRQLLQQPVEPVFAAAPTGVMPEQSNRLFLQLSLCFDSRRSTAFADFAGHTVCKS